MPWIYTRLIGKTRSGTVTSGDRVSQLLARRERHNYDDAREESLNSARTTALSRPIKVPLPFLIREEKTPKDSLPRKAVASASDKPQRIGISSAVDKKPRVLGRSARNFRRRLMSSQL